MASEGFNLGLGFGKEGLGFKGGLQNLLAWGGVEALSFSGSSYKSSGLDERAGKAGGKAG